MPCEDMGLHKTPLTPWDRKEQDLIEKQKTESQVMSGESPGGKDQAQKILDPSWMLSSLKVMF